MRNILFLVSHIGSNSFNLFECFNDNSRIVMYNNNGFYKDVTDLEKLSSLPHKIDNTAAIYGDHLLTNTTYYIESMYRMCKFVYVISSAAKALPKIVDEGYAPDKADAYYRFRLHRICEMGKRTPGAVVVTDDKMSKSLPYIEKYLGLKQSLILEEKNKESTTRVDPELIDRCQIAYERFLYYLKQQDLIVV